MDNTVALNQYKAAYNSPLTAPSGQDGGTGTSNVAAAPRERSETMAGTSGQAARINASGLPGVSRSDLEFALSNISQLRTDIAGMEAILGAVKGPGGSSPSGFAAGTYERKSVMGNKLPKLPTQAELKRRAEELIRLKQSATISPQALQRELRSKAALADNNPDFSVFFKGNVQYSVPLQSKVEPVGRGDALMLGAALNELLPEGAVTAKYRLAVRQANEAASLYTNMLDLRNDFELVDVTLRECSRQVAGHCIQRAQVMENVRNRYVEMFNVMVYVAFMLQEAFLQMQIQHDKMHSKWSKLMTDLAASKSAGDLERQLREDQAAVLARVETEMAEYKESVQSTIADLQYEKLKLTAAAQTMKDDLMRQVAEKEDQMNNMYQELHDELNSLRDEKDELIQRLHMTERQLARARQPTKAIVVYEVQATMTDKVYIYNEPQYGYQSDRHAALSDGSSEDAEMTSPRSQTERGKSAARSERRSSESGGAHTSQSVGGDAAGKHQADSKHRRYALDTESSSGNDVDSASSIDAKMPEDLASEENDADDAELADLAARLAAEDAADAELPSNLSEAEYARLMEERAARKEARRLEREALIASKQQAKAMRRAEREAQRAREREAAREGRRQQKLAEKAARAEERRLQLEEKAEREATKRAAREAKAQASVRRVAESSSEQGEGSSDSDGDGHRSGRSRRKRSKSRGAESDFKRRRDTKHSYKKAKASQGISRKAHQMKSQKTKVDDLGGFKGYFKPKRPGRVKARTWLMKAMMAIYADYLVQEKHIARDEQTDAEYRDINHFVYQWHVNKFGLKAIAEINLADLIVTVRAHAKESHKIEMFGNVLSILPSNAPCTLEHLDFYLFCIKSLAGGKPVQTMFTEDDEVYVAAPLVMEGMRLVSKVLKDDSIKDMVLDAIKLTDSVKGKALLNRITHVLAGVYHQKWLLSCWHTECLARAVDTNGDGYIDWDGFKMAGQLMSPGTPEKQVLQLFGEAVKQSRGTDKCLIATAIIKLRSGLDRMWNMDRQLPRACLELNESGVPVLNRSVITIIREDTKGENSLDARLEALMEVCDDSQSMARIVELYKHLLALLDNPPDALDVVFMVYHVLLALMAAVQTPGVRSVFSISGRRGESEVPPSPSRRAPSGTTTIGSSPFTSVRQSSPYQELKDTLDAL